MALIVQKYGGTTLASPRKLREAADRIARDKERGDDLVVVVSAMGRMTNHLTALAKRAVKKPAQRELDMLLTAGERVSMSLLSMILQERGIDAISFTGSQVGIITTSTHTEARILEIRPHRVREELKKGKVVIIAGFQGVSREKEITTLGRGGSDTTAVALAATLGAERCEIFTDVDGLYTADPRIVPKARLIEEGSYEMAEEFSALGAKMHGRSVELAKNKKVSLTIGSAKNSSGTKIQESTQPLETVTVEGVASKTGYTVFETKTDLRSFIEKINNAELPCRFFQAIQEKTVFLAESGREDVFEEFAGNDLIRKESGMGLVSLVGNGFCSSPGVLSEFLTHLKETPRLLVSSSQSLVAAIPESQISEAAQRLHKHWLE